MLSEWSGVPGADAGAGEEGGELGAAASAVDEDLGLDLLVNDRAFITAVFVSAENGRIGVCGTLPETGTRSLTPVSGC